jgi:hypothetical protein
MKLGANKNTARLAGLLYLIVVITGIFSLAYVPAKLILWNDAVKTFQQISASESLFRMSLVSSAICYIAFLLLPFVLYKLLNSINETVAKLMIVLSVVSVPISMLNLQNKYAVLTLLEGKNFLSFFNEQQIQTQIMLLLDNYNNGILILQIFWGLWLFPFGWLVYKSGFLPRILGVLLMLGCCGYLISFVGNTMMQDYGKTFIAGYVTIPASLGEIGSCLWLLIRGINEKAATNDVS